MTGDQQPSLSGTSIDGRYQVLERIGEGGMGVVYKARQVPIDRIVAIKMLNPNLARDPNWVQRFYNEAKACSRLTHPNTIRMFDFGQTDEGQLFMAMEFLDGLPLRRVIGGAAPMDPVRVLRILVQCCASLAEAHGLGIIHRDIKSDNVFIVDLAGSPDHVKLLDFSVAKLLQETEGLRTQAGVIFGTPQYMSPEQGRGEPLGPRSDLYALGILAYEMLTGRVPFSDENPMNVLAMHLGSPVPPLPPSVPREVAALVMRALEKDQAARFITATAMMDEAQHLLQALTSGPFMMPGSGSQPALSPRPPPPAYPTAGPPAAMGPPPGYGAGNAPTDLGYPQAYPSAGPMAGQLGPGASPHGHGPASEYGPASGYGRSPYPAPAIAPAGASALFWAMCLTVGLAVGIGAYLLVVLLRG